MGASRDGEGLTDINVLNGRRFTLYSSARDPDGVKKAEVQRDGEKLYDVTIRRNDNGSYPKHISDLKLYEAQGPATAKYTIVAQDTLGNTIESEPSTLQVVE